MILLIGIIIICVGLVLFMWSAFGLEEKGKEEVTSSSLVNSSAQKVQTDATQRVAFVVYEVAQTCLKATS